MGFFEDNLSAAGRGLDGCVAWFGERARALGDRGRHARSFEAIRDRMGRAADAARDGAGRSIESARSRWWRRDALDRDRLRTTGVWLGVLAVVLAGGVLARHWVSPRTASLSPEERSAIRGVQRGPGVGPDAGVAPGLEGWFGAGGP